MLSFWILHLKLKENTCNYPSPLTSIQSFNKEREKALKKQKNVIPDNHYHGFFNRVKITSHGLEAKSLNLKKCETSQAFNSYKL